MKHLSILFSFALVLAVCSSNSIAQRTRQDKILDRALIQAIEKHDRPKVIELLNQGASVDAKGINLTALQTAVFEADVEMVRLLLDKGAKINEEDLAEASRGVQGDNQKSSAIVRLLLAKGGTVARGGVDALSSAAGANNLDLVNLFLSKGVNPNGRTREGKAVLAAVIGTDSIDAIRALLAAGADAKEIDSETGQTILMRAARASHISNTETRVAILKMLLGAGANVQARDNEGKTVLHHSVQQYMSEAGGALSRPEIVWLLLERGADVNARDKHGTTALMIAVDVWRAESEIPQILIGKGADVNMANDEGQTAIMLAARDGKDEIVQLLITKGARLELKDNRGKTVLVYAVEGGHPSTAELLANRGSDVKGSPYKTEAALRVATHNFGFLRSVAYHNAADVKKFLAAGADPNFRDSQGRTGLIIEAENSYGDEIINLLLASGVNVDAADEDGNTALMLASKGNSAETVKLLLDHNATVSLKNKSQQTALLLASEDGHTRVAELLLAKGANPNDRDANGLSALLLASREYYAQEDLVKLLLAKGADPKATDQSGNTALMLAVQAGAFQIIEALVAGGVGVNERNRDGWTALRHLDETQETWVKLDSASLRRAEIKRLLLKAGAKEE